MYWLRFVWHFLGILHLHVGFAVLPAKLHPIFIPYATVTSGYQNPLGQRPYICVKHLAAEEGCNRFAWVLAQGLSLA